MNPKAIGVAAAFLGGLAVAGQSQINGDLGAHMHDGFAAALVSFLVGLVVVGAVAMLQPSARVGMAEVRSALALHKLRFWQCLGGAGGALVVASQSLTVGTLGVALFTVALVAGQSSGSLAVDRAGLGPSGPQQLTARRVTGALLTIVAVAIAVGNRLDTASAIGLAIVPVAAGLATSVQQAVNGRVRAAAGSVTAATLINFIVGTVILTIALAVDLTIRGLPTGSLPWQPWLYLGGILGVGYIALSAAIVQRIGVLLLGLASIAGQLVGAVALDALVPGGAGSPPINTLIGVALTLIAVTIAASRPRRPSS
ncbi:MAG TPA: DMT family transporter [Micromonosporaceae bacterium]